MDFCEFLILLKAKYGFVKGYSLIQSYICFHICLNRLYTCLQWTPLSLWMLIPRKYPANHCAFPTLQKAEDGSCFHPATWCDHIRVSTKVLTDVWNKTVSFANKNSSLSSGVYLSMHFFLKIYSSLWKGNLSEPRWHEMKPLESRKWRTKASSHRIPGKLKNNTRVCLRWVTESLFCSFSTLSLGNTYRKNWSKASPTIVLWKHTAEESTNKAATS